ncbi:MAG: CopG family transcriptional regulator [Deltaproteobacteria bacterium RIFOXYD12_FULL_50_9]|nr:MAG: CopG family transcriptional regulator [Deltaproteobacteria bacterium RIFOXYD12_FULL_50_9]
MSTLTIRMPEEKHNRLKILAKQQGISVNKLIEELSTVALSEFDTFTRFKIRAMKGSPKEGLALLDKLDRNE